MYMRIYIYMYIYINTHTHTHIFRDPLFSEHEILIDESRDTHEGIIQQNQGVAYITLILAHIDFAGHVFGLCTYLCLSLTVFMSEFLLYALTLALALVCVLGFTRALSCLWTPACMLFLAQVFWPGSACGACAQKDAPATAY